MVASRAENVPPLYRELFRPKEKSLIIVLLVFLVVSLVNETTVLHSLSQHDRSILSTTDTGPELPETPQEKTSGTFNNLEIVYRGSNRTLYSSAECFGESFSQNSWMYRSCLYRNLCFDTSSNEFVLFQSPSNKLMEQSIIPNTHFLASSLNTSVSLGGFVSQWKKRGIARLRWSPTILDPKELVSNGYYEIGNTVVIPFHTMAAHNIGHFIWDSLLPIYALSSILGLVDNQLVPMRYILKGKPLPFTCEGRFMKGCEGNFQRLLPMVGVHRSTFSTTKDFQLNLTDHQQKSRFVCSSLGAAGIGYLTDHGRASHGKHPSDYTNTYNYGRGPILFGFRNFVLQNMGLSHLPLRVQSKPIRITFSLHSSGRDHRNLDFQKEIAALQALPHPNVVVESYSFSQLDMKQEMQIIASSAILVTACGGGAVTSMFLPRGASLIMFYAAKKEGVPNTKLDWDPLSNLGYTRTHWLLIEENRAMSTNAFVNLIQNEVEIMSHS